MHRKKLPPPITGRKKHWKNARQRRREALRRERDAEERNFLGNCSHWSSAPAAMVADLTWWTVAKTIEGAVALVRCGVRRARAKKVGRELAAMGLPTPNDLRARWFRTPRKTLEEALLIGAMLLKISSTVDVSWTRDEEGRMKSRGGGLKAWLAEFCPDIPYSTACRYRKLAARLLELLALEGEGAGWAMEWVLPGQPWPRGVGREGETAEGIRAVRNFVEGLLTFHPSQRGLRWLLTRELARAKAA